MKATKFIKYSAPYIFLVLFVALCIQGCEKDDICSEDTQKTPLVKVIFEDIMSNNVKQVPSLQVAFDEELTVSENLLLPALAADVSEINLPLDTQKNSTTFYFIRDSGVLDDEEQPIQDIDTIEIIYSRNYEYISRACGYKVTFEALFNPQTTADFESDDKWIKQVFVENSTVENSEETHIIIRH